MSRRAISLIALIALVQSLRAEISAELAEASAPLAEGVPEVAVTRLEALLNKNLSDPEWRAVVEKLAEAQKVTERKIQEMADAQKHADQRMDALILTVDEIIRGRDQP